MKLQLRDKVASCDCHVEKDVPIAVARENVRVRVRVRVSVSIGVEIRVFRRFNMSHYYTQTHMKYDQRDLLLFHRTFT